MQMKLIKVEITQAKREETNNRYLQGLTAALWTGRLGRQVPPSGGECVQAVAIDPHFVVFLV
jgi:hypothetical protein